MYDVLPFVPADPKRIEFQKSRCLANCELAGVPELSNGFAKTVYFLDDENPEDFMNMLAGLHSDLKPGSLIERIRVEHLACAQWAVMRYARLQSLAVRSSQTQAILTYQRAQLAAERAFERAHRLLQAVRKGDRRLASRRVSTLQTRVSAPRG